MCTCLPVGACLSTFVCVCQGGWLCAGVYLGGDGRDILIDPLISGPRRGEGAKELKSTWEKNIVESNKAKKQEGKERR